MPKTNYHHVCHHPHEPPSASTRDHHHSSIIELRYTQIERSRGREGGPPMDLAAACQIDHIYQYLRRS